MIFFPRALRVLAQAAALIALAASATPALAIKGGKASVDPQGVRRHVVQIRGPEGTQCTGTVIAQHLVITAAHCFLSGHGDYEIRALDPRFRFRVAHASQVAIHPEFDVRALGTSAPLNDIALLRVPGNFPDWLVPVPLASAVPNDGVFVDVVAAGFGMSRDRQVRSAGTLRQMHFAMLERIDGPSKLLFLIDRTATKKEHRFGICRGDSGGPVFLKTAQGPVLVGVISAVIAGRDSDCGSITAVTAVPAYRGFIQELAGRANDPVRFR